ncbi:MAG: hypothetical protein LCI00_16610 [Chloroflexi bacterium]|nr:hypothetical protein [Chloroflexota bacterium]MCC6896612.1 hypothetical protein [Anaerolineae bacterium]
MKIYTDDNVLEIRLLETGREDFHIGVKVNANGFVAQKESIGINRASFHVFVRQLKAFQEKQSGEVILDSMSPGEFQMALRAAGKRYHVVVQGQISRTIYQAESALLNTLQFAFRVDTAYLKTIVEDFEGLLNEQSA